MPASAIPKIRRVLAGATLALGLGAPEPGDGLLAGNRSAIACAGEAVAAPAERAVPASELAAFEASIAREPKRVPSNVRAGLARGEAQDVIVLFFSADVEETIGRASVSRENARGMRAAHYASTKRVALSSAISEAEVLREYPQLPMVHLRLRTLESLQRLLARPEVAVIYEDSIFRLQLSESLPLIGQPAAAAAGHRGAGTTVVVLDSGIDYTRPAFGSCTAPNAPGSCRVVVSEDLAPPDGQLDEPELHGTHVSAIVLGVATESRLAVLDVFEGAAGRFSAILDGFNWAIVNRDRYNVVAVNMSFGSDEGVTAPCEDAGYSPAVQLLRSEGILPVAASGNNAFTNQLGAPACTPGVVSVGAVYDANVGGINATVCTDATTRADQVMCFSDSASFMTMLAPGGRITATGLSGFGTSLSAPHVSGAVAALRGTYPTETPEQITTRMVSTGEPVTDPRNGLTKPRLALDRAAAAPPPPPPPPLTVCPAQRVSCPANISATLSPSSCGTGRLSSGHFTDTYEFLGAAGQTVTIQMFTSAPPAQLDPYVVVVSPSGHIAAQNDDIALGVDVNSRIVFTLNESGIWRVEASTFSPGMSGNYTLTITGCSAPTPFVCAAGSNTLCLSGGRFRVRANWRTADGASGSGTAVSLTPDTGYFWFFDPANVELIAKVLNACGVNQRIWVFGGGLTNVEVTLTVEDSNTGFLRTYRNPQGTAFLPIQDTQAFATCSGSPSSVSASGQGPPGGDMPSTRGRPPAVGSAGSAGANPRPYDVSEAPVVGAALAAARSAAACTNEPNALCLSSGRFRVTTAWRTADGSSGVGTAVPLTSDTGYFWFFSAQNVEMIVKVLNACGVNGRIWVFAGGLTNVEVTMTVEDTATGLIQSYRNPQGTAFAPIQDTGAFATCP